MDKALKDVQHNMDKSLQVTRAEHVEDHVEKTIIKN